MSELLAQYARIAFLIGRPQDLPAGVAQMKLGMGLFLLTGLFSLMATAGVGQAILQMLVDMGCSAALFYGGLAWLGRTARFSQAYGALCGAGAVLNLAAAPVFWSRPAGGGAPVSGVVAFTEFMFLVWSMTVFAHVLRHTFEINRVMSIGVTFVYLVLLLTVLSGVMPSPMATPSPADVVQ